MTDKDPLEEALRQMERSRERWEKVGRTFTSRAAWMVVGAMLLQLAQSYGWRNLSTFLRRRAELFTESPPVSTRAG
jgi:hypothetical protein